VVIQLLGPYGTASIINIYNDQAHSDSLEQTDALLSRIAHTPLAFPLFQERYTVLAGDFNRHHPRWDEERNHHLFTTKAIEEAEYVLSIIDEHGLDMALPKNIPTLEVMSTKNWTQPNNVFCSVNAIDVLVRCTIVPEDREAGTDHLPVDTILDLLVEKAAPPESFNFRAANWDTFIESVHIKLAVLPPILVSDLKLNSVVESPFSCRPSTRR
jgi:hypothetical protein